jgi:leucyl-tRNA synthetase
LAHDYEFREIERKWQARWEAEGTFQVGDEDGRPKVYGLEMFPYPSGSGLHVGHLKNYVPMDAFCRFQSMNGQAVLHPMGWDAFGQPAENEAIRTGRNPRDMVPEYAATYRRTLKLVGCSYDWSREINSSLPDYYRWTQWFFLLLYRRGLAYRATSPISWCPSCKTGLANEEVKDGRCWRCDSVVEKKPMPQWFFRITAYAERLLRDLDGLDWSDGMKEMQRDWIGRSEGAEVDFAVEGTDQTLRVFTTRPDTLFGATFMVLAPEHPLVARIATEAERPAVEEYVRRSQALTEIDRMNAERASTGVFTGGYAVNPVNGRRMPIWIADYVLMGYGTGAIMAVPGHDTRDFAFARRFGLPIVQVVSRDGSRYDLEAAEPEEGIAVNSGRFDGLTTAAFKAAISDWLEAEGKGGRSITYRIRDWLISRQRYWGAPIPMVHCPSCGTVPVPEEQLPVLLPDVEHYEPSGTGESPLATIPEFVNTSCPSCGEPARRETDTMGGYACSSWYFFRFADPHNQQAFASRERIDRWLPVDVYAGGVEHARSHLLYSRFWTKVLYDAGMVGFTEPFLTLKNQGSLLAYTPGRKPRQGEQADGDGSGAGLLDWIVLKPEERAQHPAAEVVWRWARMSKSKGNVVTPDQMVDRYGADALRLYEMFAAPYEADVQWSEEGINGAFRFVARVWRWINAARRLYDPDWRSHLTAHPSPAERQVRRKLHQVIRKVGADLQGFQFNTAVAAMMELMNDVTAHYALADRETLGEGHDPALVSELVESLVLILAPFAPHVADELWERLGKAGSTYRAAWPRFDPDAAADEEVTIVLQVNGKLRSRLTVPPDIGEPALRELALADPAVLAHTGGKTVRKVIIARGKLVNVVAN